jgi:HK97 family phage prohead protease
MSNEKLELRYANEIRQSEQGKAKHLFGYAASYNTPTVIGGMYNEEILPGAFDRTLASNPDVRCLFGHSDLNVLGRTTSGTLTLRSDSRGLYYDCELPDTQAAQDLWKSVQRKDITGSSFGFFIVKENIIPASKPGELATRQIVEASLDGGDVSPCTYPAYEQGTSVQARSLAPITDETESRRQRAASILNDHATWKASQSAAETQEENLRKARLQRVAAARSL